MKYDVYPITVRTVDGPKDGFAIQCGDAPGFGDTIMWSRLEADEESVRIRRRDADRAARKERHDAEVAKQAAEEAARRDFCGWEATLTPMALGRAVACLTSQIQTNGQVTTRKAIIIDYVARGAVVGVVSGKPALEMPDGTFRWQSSITKLGMDFAEYLIERRSNA